MISYAYVQRAQIQADRAKALSAPVTTRAIVTTIHRQPGLVEALEKATDDVEFLDTLRVALEG